MAELQDKIELAAPLDWSAEELLVVDTAGPNPATWPVLKAFALQVRHSGAFPTLGGPAPCLFCEE